MSNLMTGNANLQIKPLSVTFFLFSYNQEKYIEDACKAALRQAYSPLEIVFSDDCSSDKTFEIIQRITRDYKGPHQVKLNRNEQNCGLIGHVNKSFEITSCDLMVLAAGDDISLPDRVQCLVDAFNRSEKKALVIHSSVIKIDDFNNELGILIPPCIVQPMSYYELVDCQSLYIGATAAFSRALYSKFGPIVFQDAYEDLVFGFRAAIEDSLVYVDKPLVRYRVGVGLSKHVKISIFKMAAKIVIRRKKLKMVLAVYEQRLMDLRANGSKDDILKIKLMSNISVIKKRLLFYRDPLAFLLCLCSKDFIVALRAFNYEVQYISGWYDFRGRWMI